MQIYLELAKVKLDNVQEVIVIYSYVSNIIRLSLQTGKLFRRNDRHCCELSRTGRAQAGKCENMGKKIMGTFCCKSPKRSKA